MNLLRQVRITVERYAMLRPGDRILAAVSGGADSVALLRVLALLAPEYRLELTAAHLNHGLRGEEALQEEAFVRSLSAAMGLACVCKTIDVRSIRKGRSLEEAAREERYRFLKEAAAGCGAGKIATGHHRDDQAETVLMHLIRGSGPGGLKGILPVREDRVIRPLFEVDRREILGFLDREGLSYRTDSSNRDPAFLRNRIRNDLIPALAKDYNPRIVEGLCHAAEILRQQEDYLQRATGRILKRWRIPPGAGEIHVPLENFLNLHESLRGRIIQTLLKAAAPSGRGIAFRHVEAVLDLCRRFRHGRASLDLPFRLVAETGDGSLRIGRDPGGGAREGRGIRAPEYEYPLEIPGEILLREAGSTLRLESGVGPPAGFPGDGRQPSRGLHGLRPDRTPPDPPELPAGGPDGPAGDGGREKTEIILHRPEDSPLRPGRDSPSRRCPIGDLGRRREDQRTGEGDPGKQKCIESGNGLI